MTKKKNKSQSEEEVMKQGSAVKQTTANQYQYQSPKIVLLLAKKREIEDKYFKYMANKRPKQIEDEDIERPMKPHREKIDKDNNTKGKEVIKVENKMGTTANLATNLNHFDSELGSVEDSKTPSPKCEHFNTNVGTKLFEADGAHDGKEFEGNPKHYTNKYIYDGREFEGNENKLKCLISKYEHDGKEFEGNEKKNIILNQVWISQ